MNSDDKKGEDMHLFFKARVIKMTKSFRVTIPAAFINGGNITEGSKYLFEVKKEVEEAEEVSE